MNADDLNLFLNISAVVGGAFGIYKAIREVAKIHQSMIETNLAVQRDINHLKNDIRQHSLNLEEFVKDIHGTIKEIDHRQDRIEVDIAVLKSKLHDFIHSNP